MERHRRQGRRDPRRPPRRPDRTERPADANLSRFLAFVLRHHPEEIGLTLDDEGAVDLDQLLEALRTRPGFGDMTRERVERLLAEGPSAQRFEVRANRVRARYGHSLAQPIRYAEGDPPAWLFHATTPEGADQVLADGLNPAERQRVHLSIDTPAAREVGRRRCPDPVLLRIDTAAARKAGVRFYPGGPAVWLSDDIPSACITRLP